MKLPNYTKRIVLLIALFFFLAPMTVMAIGEEVTPEPTPGETEWQYIYAVLPPDYSWLSINLAKRIDDDLAVVEFGQVPYAFQGWFFTRSNIVDFDEDLVSSGDVQQFVTAFSSLRYVDTDDLPVKEVEPEFGDNPSYGVIITAAMGMTPADGVAVLSMFFGEPVDVNGVEVVWTYVVFNNEPDNGYALAMHPNDVALLTEFIDSVIEDDVDLAPFPNSQGASI